MAERLGSQCLSKSFQSEAYLFDVDYLTLSSDLMCSSLENVCIYGIFYAQAIEK